MTFSAILIPNVFGVSLLLCLLVSNIRTRQRRRLDDKIFIALVLMVMAASAIETLGFYLDGKPGMLTYCVNLYGSTYLYAANIVGGFMWTLFVDVKLYRDRERLKKRLLLYGFLPAISVAALIVNLFRPFLFRVNSDYLFERLYWCWTMYVMVFLAAGFSIYIYYDFLRKHGRVFFFPVWIFMIPITLGSLIQGLFYGISTAWPSAAIALTALHISLQNQKSFIDPLTGLYNRLFLEHTLASVHGLKYYGIMLDLNFFKRINDAYGHSAGDRALNDAAKIMNRAMFVKGSVYRYAGDEFVIMLETDSEDDVLETERRIREQTDRFRETKTEPYEISFSMGHAKLEKDDTEDEFLRKIDLAMYIDKERMHKLLDSEERSEAENDIRCDEEFFIQKEKYEGIVTHFASEDEVMLPERYTWSNKASYGKLLIIAGNRGCSGAGYLTAHSAFMAGCGMVKVLTCEDTAKLLNQMQPEAMTGVLFTGDGYDAKVLEDGLAWADTVLIGPGLGTSEAAKEVLQKVLAAGRKSVVDADALNIIAGTITGTDRKERAAAIAKLFTAPAVLTPHIGELSRLTGLDAAELKARIFDTAYEYTYNNILTYVCKDARTVAASGGHLHYNTNGNSGMATAGSGDVLAGLIAGLMAAGLEPYEAARSGVYIHAAAGDEAAAKSCEDCITAGDIANNLPVCISRLRKR